MAKKDGPKHTIVIDADLHVQDPHEIILSYFNTQPDSPFIQGEKKSFMTKLAGLFIGMLLLKFFFQEMISSIFVFILFLVVSVILGYLFAFCLLFVIHVFNRAIKSSHVVGIFWTILFMTVIVLTLGVFM